jgi:hypothetical protein
MVPRISALYSDESRPGFFITVTHNILLTRPTKMQPLPEHQNVDP